MKLNQNSREAGSTKAFTLVELMVVVAIVAIVASLAFTVGRSALEKRAKAGVVAQLASLETMIKDYHSKYNSFPPDNPTNTQVNALYYELMGATYDHTTTPPRYTVEELSLPETKVLQYFGREGLQNVSQLADQNNSQAPKHKRYFDSLSADRYRAVSNVDGLDLRLLRVPVKDFDSFMVNALDGTTMNVWHYRSTNPTNNQASFDLWATFEVGDSRFRVSNWENGPVKLSTPIR